MANHVCHLFSLPFLCSGLNLLREGKQTSSQVLWQRALVLQGVGQRGWQYSPMGFPVWMSMIKPGAWFPHRIWYSAGRGTSQSRPCLVSRQFGTKSPESRRTRTVLSQEPQGWHMSTLSTCMAQGKGPKPLHAPTPPQQIPQTSPHLQAPIWSPASLQPVELSDIVHICKHCLPAMMLSLFLNYFVTPTVPISQSSWGQPWSQCAFPGRLTYG